MKKYIRILSCCLLVCVLCAALFSCSGKKIKEISAPKDVYIVSLYSFVSGGISYYDYDSDGRLLSITPVDPTTMQFADDTMGLSVKYNYSDDGSLSAMKFLEYDMTLEYSADGMAIGANYSDGEGGIDIKFEYDDRGRIKKESIYTDGEIFLVSEYNSIGMLTKETMSFVGDAAYVYAESYSKAEYTLSYSEIFTYEIDEDSKGRPASLKITSAESTQDMLWEYEENGLCRSYIEKTQNSQTRYLHTYNSESKLVKTESYYKALDDDEYLQELVEYTYDAQGNVATDKYSCYLGDGALFTFKYNEYENKLCTKSIEEEYSAGVVEKRSVVTTEYNDNDLVTLYESVVYLGDGSVDKRSVDNVEYDSDNRISRLTTKSYGKGDVYTGMFIEDYEYLESGGYRLTISEYDVEGNLINTTEEIVEE